MTKKQIAKELKKLKFETFENKPGTDKPYLPDIVKRRTLLLYAQVHLAEISWAKKCKDLKSKNFHTKMYYTIMSKYYEWEK